MKRFLLFATISIVFFSCSKVEYTNQSLTQAFKEAQESNKKIFVYVGHSGCKKCERLSKKLDRNKTAKKILKRDFICLMVNQDDESGREFAQITGCPFYPYSCFFDQKGKLLNLRIGDKEFDFEAIEKNTINIYTYRELFRLPISFEEYKKRVSLSMKAFLHRNMAKTGSHGFKKALKMSQQSIDIHPYSYNLYSAAITAKKLGDTISFNKYSNLFKQQYSIYDDFLFENLIEKLEVRIDNYRAIKKEENKDYKFAKKRLNLNTVKLKSKTDFRYEVSNTGKQPLIITLANSSCGCTELDWTKKPIMPGEKGFVKGKFLAQEKGNFFKQIFVHLSSKEAPMCILSLQGYVQEK